MQHTRAHRSFRSSPARSRAIVGALALVLATTAAADEPRNAGAPRGDVSAPGTAPGTAPVTREEAEKAVRAMRDVIARVSKKVDEARRQRDVLRLNCIDDKRNLMEALLKVAQSALDEVKVAKNAPPEAVEHELSRIVIARDKVEGYVTEAEQCMGSVAFREGEELERSFHDANEDMRSDDPTAPEPVQTSGYRPPPASPMN